MPKLEFAKRLNQVLDELQPPAPPPGEGRQQFVANMFGVDQTAARKWLIGDGFPAMTRAITMAQTLHVGIEWLLTGRGDKRVEDQNNTELAKLLDQWFRMTTEEQRQFLRYGEFLCSDRRNNQPTGADHGFHNKLQ